MARILWVDDQQNAASTFSAVLSPLNARVIWASDGTEALACSRGSFLTSSFRISGCLPRNGAASGYLRESATLESTFLSLSCLERVPKQRR